MKMSKKDQNLLLFLVGALVIVVVWFFVVSPMRQKTESLRMENSSLKGTAELYQSINMNKDEYEKSILVLEDKRDNILDDYPSNMLTTDKIMYLTNLENFYVEDVAVAGMAFDVVEEVIPEVSEEEQAAQTAQTAETTTDEEGNVAEAAPATEEENAENQGLHLYKVPVNYNFRATYTGSKDMIEYLFDNGYRKSIRNMNLAYDTETGQLAGDMDVDFYYILGTDKLYDPISIPPVRKGVPNVFHTVEGGDINSSLSAEDAADAEDEADAEDTEEESEE